MPLGATGRPFPDDGDKSGSGSHSPAAGLIRIAVVGAHLSGMPLNHQLTQRGARLVAATQTSSAYRLYALPGTVPPKPGLARVSGGSTGAGTGAGTAIAMELWDKPLNCFGEFVAEVPAPLGIGSVELDNGTWVKGFICEPCGIDGALDISAFGGWKNFLASKTKG